MNRRQFLGTLIGGIAAEAAVRTWPYRVFSFPSQPRIAAPWVVTSSAGKGELFYVFFDPVIGKLVHSKVGVLKEGSLTVLNDGISIGLDPSSLEWLQDNGKFVAVRARDSFQRDAQSEIRSSYVVHDEKVLDAAELFVDTPDMT